jgi:virulence factor Mce-like protein
MPARLRTLPLLLVLAFVLGTGGCSPLDSDRIRVTALFDDSSGLFVGNDVGILGVPVGRVTSIEPRGTVVAVELELEQADVPATAGAVVVARSVATDRYVELTPAFDDGPRMEDGAVIPLERTRTPVEFDEVLASLQDFSRGLRGPDGNARNVTRLLASGAEALAGRGADANQTLKRLAGAAAALSDHRGDIVGTVDELDQLTQLLAANRAVVDQFIVSVADATDLFADERRSFGRALSSLSRALHSLAGFVRENRVQLRSSMQGLTRVTDDLLEHEAELAESLEVLPVTFQNTGLAVDGHQRLDVKLPMRYLSPEQRITEPFCAALPAALCNELGTDPDIGDLLGNFLRGGP